MHALAVVSSYNLVGDTMLEPVLKSDVDRHEAGNLLQDLKRERKTLSLTVAQWGIIDPLLTQLERACIRRIRGDA